MFSNIDEILAALKGLPGQMGGAMPQVGPEGQVPMAPTPVAPPQAAPAVDPATTGSIPPNAGQYASFANPNGASAPGLTGQFPDAPGMGGMLGPAGRALGTNDGTAGPTAFGGLLNFKDEDSKQAALRGMLAGSMGLMAAGGPSDKPHSVGQDFAQGGMAGIAGYEGSKDANSDRAYKNAQTQRFGVANAADAQKMALEQRQAAARARLFGGVGFDGGSNTGATAAPIAASASPAPAGGNDLAGQINRQRATYQAQYNGLMAMGDGDNARPIFAQMNNLDNEAAKQGLVWNGQTYRAAPGFNEGAAGLKQAEAAGTSLGQRNAWTNEQKELNQINAERNAKGLPPLGLEEYQTSQKRAGATQVNVGDGNKYGTIPPGYRLVEGPNGAYMEAIPGSPDAVKADQAAKAKDTKSDHAQVSSDAVDTAFNNILRVDGNSWLPTTGFTGGLLANIGGTGSNDMRAALETMKANASLTTLQKMRDESPTGAGMGSPSDSEQKMIQASFATLEQSQSREEFVRNLNNFRNMWMDLVHGPGNGPERHPVAYGLKPLTEGERKAAETGQQAPAADWKPRSTQPATQPVRIANDADFAKLPSGSKFIGPDGVQRTKP
jgi:hypothetical protein